MTKFHSLLLAFAVSCNMYSQTPLSFTACTSGNNTLNTNDITTDQNGVVYVATNTGVIKSVDNGVTFTNTSLNTGALAIITLGNKIITQNKISIDGGSTWNSHTMFSSLSSSNIKRFIKISESVAYVFFGASSYYKTLDGGTTWSSGLPTQLPTVPSGSQYFNGGLFRVNNGDVFVACGGGGFNGFLISKDNLATYSYSISLPISSIWGYSTGYLDTNNNYVLYTGDGYIHGYSQNQNHTTPTFTNSYTISGNTNTVSAFGSGVMQSNGSFLVFDGNATTNAILRTAGTTTNTANGINELSDTKINLYPNPCANQIIIDGLQGDVNYSITNQLGQIMVQGKTNSIVNTTSLEPGVYFTTLNNTRVIKFIKE